MKVLGDLTRSLDTSLLKRRLLTAAVVACLIAWDMHKHHRRIDEGDVVGNTAAILSFFVAWRGKTFWFLWGIAIGVLLLSIVRLAFVWCK